MMSNFEEENGIENAGEGGRRGKVGGGGGRGGGMVKRREAGVGGVVRERKSPVVCLHDAEDR